MKAEIELSERLRKACVEKGITEPRFVAQDYDGFWYHYNIKPKPLWTTWSCGRDVPGLGQTETNEQWRDTLMEFVTPKIEAGKRYWRRDGSVSGWLEKSSRVPNGCFCSLAALHYDTRGKAWVADMANHSAFDLIAEYREESIAEWAERNKNIVVDAEAYFAPSIASRDEFMDERVRPKTTQETDPLGFGDDISVTHHLDPDKFSVKAIRQDDRIEIVVTEKKTLV